MNELEGNFEKVYENVLTEETLSLNSGNVKGILIIFSQLKIFLLFFKVFHMELIANWGNADFIGLTSIQFLGLNSKLISMKNCTIRCYSTNTVLDTSVSLEKSPDYLDSVSKFIIYKFFFKFIF